MLSYRSKTIINAQFQNQDLKELCFWGGIFKNANLTNANIQGSDLRTADFSHSSFKNTQCQNTNFSGTKLYNTDFTGANLTNATFSHPSIFKSIITPTTILDGAVYWYLGEEKIFLTDLFDFKNLEKIGT